MARFEKYPLTVASSPPAEIFCLNWIVHQTNESINSVTFIWMMFNCHLLAEIKEFRRQQILKLDSTSYYAFLMSSADAFFGIPRALYKLSVSASDPPPLPPRPGIPPGKSPYPPPGNPPKNILLGKFDTLQVSPPSLDRARAARRLWLNLTWAWPDLSFGIGIRVVTPRASTEQRRPDPAAWCPGHRDMHRRAGKSDRDIMIKIQRLRRALRH